jgi:hypothetical protein
MYTSPELNAATEKLIAVRARPGRLSACFYVDGVSMALLYGRAGRLNAQNGGFRPGQCAKKNGKILGMFQFGTDRVVEFLQKDFPFISCAPIGERPIHGVQLRGGRIAS